MAHIIEIHDSENELLTVTLPMLLNEIDSSGEELHWSILHLSGTGKLANNKSIVDFENEIYESDKGVIVSWNELKALSIEFDQLFDILIIGTRSKEDIKKYDNDETLYSKFSIVLDLFDGAYWKIYSKEESIINNMYARFSEVKLR